MRSSVHWALPTAIVLSVGTVLPANGQSVPDTLQPARLTGLVLTADRPARAVAAADVRLLGQPGRWLTDRFGRFVIPEVDPGTVVIRVEHVGYAPVQDSIHLTGGLTYHADIRMSARPIELEGIEVTVHSGHLPRSLEAVYERMERANFGRFMTDEDFKARGYPAVKDMLWGVNFRGVPAGFDVPIYLDGVRVAGREFLDMLTQEVAVLEIYSSPAGIPVQYRDPGTFGAVFIWTKW